ncbi:MAG: histidine phosphatase family protein [Clostridia bacterium]|nr:histidine phosphatase family protein [Clostridia bacterium]
MKIYIMRHGTTVWNEKGIIQGRSQNRLSKEGVLLTEKVARNFKDAKIDIILCSPMMRTMQTANIVNRYHNVKIVKEEKLIEVDQGVLSGRKKRGLTEDEKKAKELRLAEFGMETWQSVFERMKTFLEKLKKEEKSKNVLVVTHNACASYLSLILENAEVDFNSLEHRANFANAQIKEYDI